MMTRIEILATQATTLLAAFVAVQGHLWITEGTGLHPLLAGAGAAILAALPYMREGNQ